MYENGRDSAKLSSILVASKDGDWGMGEPRAGLEAYRVIRGADFPVARLNKTDDIPTRYLEPRTASRRTLELGDIVIETAGGSRDRSTGRTLLVTRALLENLSLQATCASFARFLRIDENLAEPRYVYWYLQYLHRSGEMWKHQVQHTGVARFQFTRFASEHDIPIPPRREQEAIADILGTLEEKIAVNESTVVKIRELGLHEFRHSITQRSDVVTLGLLTSMVSRGVTPRYSDDDAELLVLNQKCIREGRVSLEPARRTLSSRVPSPKLLVMNDVLVNSTGVGTLGRVSRWTQSEPCTTDSHVTIVRFDEACTDPVVAGFAMIRAQPQIEALGQGSTGQTELSRLNLCGLDLTLPPPGESARLRPILDSLEKRADAALRESESLARLRDALLPRLMSGEIHVRAAEKIVEDVT